MRPAAKRQGALTRGLVTLAACAAGLALLYGIFGAPWGDDVETGAAERERGYYLEDATLTEMGPDGTPRVVVRAKTIEQQISDQSVLLSNLALDYRTEAAGTWTVTADQGRMPVDRASLLLSGDVIVTGTEARGAAVIRTDHLAYDTASSVIQTADPVTVQFGPHQLKGRGLRVVLNDGTLRLESNVNGRFKP